MPRGGVLHPAERPHHLHEHRLQAAAVPVSGGQEGQHIGQRHGDPAVAAAPVFGVALQLVGVPEVFAAVILVAVVRRRPAVVPKSRRRVAELGGMGRDFADAVVEIAFVPGGAVHFEQVNGQHVNRVVPEFDTARAVRGGALPASDAAILAVDLVGGGPEGAVIEPCTDEERQTHARSDSVRVVAVDPLRRGTHGRQDILFDRRAQFRPQVVKVRQRLEHHRVAPVPDVFRGRNGPLDRTAQQRVGKALRHRFRPGRKRCRAEQHEEKRRRKRFHLTRHGRHRSGTRCRNSYRPHTGRY